MQYFDKSFINNEWVAESSQTFKVINPADGSVLGTVADGGKEIVNKAVEAAYKAFPAWRQKTAKERSAILIKWFQLMVAHKDKLAEMMTKECGKPLAESLGEVAYGSSFVEWFAEEGKRIYGDIIPPHTADRRLAVIKQPIGVVGAITPWNFPLAMITRKIAPALAAGCTVVVRPSEETPFTALAIADLAKQAGFPAGVINMVVGTNASEIGKTLCEHPKVSKISFTGSTRVGHILMQQSASTLKKLSLELGGNAPFIVFADADLDQAVKGGIVAKFRNAGQTCVCVNRFIVQDEIYDAFCEKFTVAVNQLKVGNGLEQGVNIGPLINAKAMTKVEGFVSDAVQKGGKILTGGKRIDDRFFQPTVIKDALSSMNFSCDEVFGPIAPIFKFKTDQEAVALANDTIYGLASYFYTKDVTRCWKVAEQLEYGMVGINEGLVSTEIAPFGGVKYSGHGREGSKYGIDNFVEIKYLCFGNIV